MRTPLALLAALLIGCGSDKAADSGGPPPTGTTPTGAGTTPTTGGTPVARTLIEGCDPTWCTFTAGGGRLGGDLCSCTLDGDDHPTTDSVEGSCFGGDYVPEGFDLTLHFDLETDGYAAYAVDTCLGYFDDSSLAVFRADPVTGGNEIECVEDASTEDSFCAKLTDPEEPGVAPRPTQGPNSGNVWIVIDEWERTQIWNGATPRVVEVELFDVMPVCGDDVVGYGEECDDGGIARGDGCDERCQREPVCGDSFVDTPEDCDDGNLADGDGCSSACDWEPVILVDCDPAFCVFAAGAGPTGGDLCTCTIPGAEHPRLAALEPECGFGFGAELILSFDRGAYGSVAASTCDLPGGTSTAYGYYYQSSVVSTYGDDPLAGAAPDACNDDAIAEGNGCSKLWDPEVPGEPPMPVNLPPGGSRVYVVVDDAWGTWWDHATDRVVTVELSAAIATVCGDGVPERNEGCDDGNLVDGDGCSATCAIEPLTLEGCDAEFCTLELGTGPNGGDLCTCTLEGYQHPTIDDVDNATCFGGYGAPELMMHVDLAAGGYAFYAIDTCVLAGAAGNADSSVAAYDAHPNLGGAQVGCNDDAQNEPTFCSKLTDSGAGLPPNPRAAPASGHVWLQVDSWDTAGGYAYWDGVTERSFTVELIP